MIESSGRKHIQYHQKCKNYDQIIRDYLQLQAGENIINIINFQIWSNPQRENTFNIFNNGKNIIKSSGITYNSKLEAPSKKSYGGIVNGHHLKEY